MPWPWCFTDATSAQYPYSLQLPAPMVLTQDTLDHDKHTQIEFRQTLNEMSNEIHALQYLEVPRLAKLAPLDLSLVHSAVQCSYLSYMSPSVVI